FHERHQDVEPGLERLRVLAEALHHVRALLRHDDGCLGDHDEDDDHGHDRDDEKTVHVCDSFWWRLMSAISWRTGTIPHDVTFVSTPRTTAASTAGRDACSSSSRTPPIASRSAWR